MRWLSSDGRQSWRPGKRSSFSAADEGEDDEEIAARKAHEKREAAWKQQQNQQQEQAQKKKQQQKPASEKTVLEQLNITHRARRPASSSNAAAAAESSSSESRAAAPPAAGSVPDLKKMLRQFYLLIHPDFFEAHPKEKSTNAASLALLSDFLDSLRGEGDDASAARQHGRAASKTVRLQFWLRKKQSDEATAAASSTSDASAATPAFYSVNSTLSLGGGQQHLVDQAALYTALSSLFRQAGIKHANHWLWGDEFAAGAAASSAQSGQGQGQSRRAGQQRQPTPSGRGAASSMDEEYFNYFTSGPGGVEFQSQAGSPGAAGEFEAFLRANRAAAHHYEQVARPAKHDALLRLANLRLQGIKVLFEMDGSSTATNSKEGEGDDGGEAVAAPEELSYPQQMSVLDVYEKAIQSSKYFKAPHAIFSRPTSASSPASPPTPSPWGGAFSHSAHSAAPEPEPEQPTTPHSQSVRMPEEFSDIFEQIKKHRVREEGGQSTVAAAAGMPQHEGTEGEKNERTSDGGEREGEAKPDPSSSSFESRRSPFSRVTSVFSSSPALSRCIVDGRGRLVFSLRSPSSDWVRFVSSSRFLISAALATAFNHRALKTREKQVAEVLGVADVFCEASLLQGGPVGLLRNVATKELLPPEAQDRFRQEQIEKGQVLGSSPAPKYQSFLARMQREAHVLHDVRGLFPAVGDITLLVLDHTPPPRDSPFSEERVTVIPPASQCFSVDPTLGLLLVPLHATASELRDALLERGQECVQIQQRHREELAQHAQALLHAKRHLKVRELTLASDVTREQAVECAQRLSRVFGSMRDHLQATSLYIAHEYDCSMEDGKLTIPWNWS